MLRKSSLQMLKSNQYVECIFEPRAMKSQACVSPIPYIVVRQTPSEK